MLRSYKLRFSAIGKIKSEFSFAEALSSLFSEYMIRQASHSFKNYSCEGLFCCFLDTINVQHLIRSKLLVLKVITMFSLICKLSVYVVAADCEPNCGFNF